MHSGGELENKMERCLLLGTYVKRCSNLMLAADNCRTMRASELYLSIRESLEQLKALGIVCELTKGKQIELSTGWLITAYDVFEAVIESVMDSASAISVKVSPAEDILLSIETDSEVNTDNIEVRNLKLTAFIEDGIQHITLSTGGAVNG